MVDAHVHLAAQLRAEHSHLTAASAWDSMALAQLVEGHIEVARQTSSRLSMFSSVWLIAFGYTCISGLLDTAIEGAAPRCHMHDACLRSSAYTCCSRAWARATNATVTICVVADADCSYLRSGIWRVSMRPL